MAQYSPGMMQYLSIKEDYKDTILFFRMGDFYEIFFEDAVIAAKELEIVLTSRSSKKDNSEDRIPMCGFPYKALDNYVDMLVEKGYKIAVCEQVEDPKKAKGIVKREVVQLITPGTIMQGRNLEAKSNNYIATVSEVSEESFCLAYIDLTTGESHITVVKGTFKDVLGELNSLGIKEIVLDSNFNKDYLNEFNDKLSIMVSYEDITEVPLDLADKVKKLKSDDLINTFGRLLNYLIRTQKRSLDHIQEVIFYELNQYMKMDIFSKRNLELLETNRTKDKKGSLLWLLDETATAMGGRRLKQWLEKPLISRVEIEKRLNMVDCLLNNYFYRNELRESLKEVYDLERLSGRVAYGNVNAKDLIQLKRSLKSVPDIIDLVNEIGNEDLSNIVNGVDKCHSLYELLEISIKENPSMSIKEGDIIKDGYNEKLDEYRDAINNGEVWVSQLEQRERELTGIKNLKINYNRATGYSIEISKSNLHLLPEGDGRYIRKQTLKNVERYITNELKEKEQIILEAGEKMIDLEYDLFLEIREEVSKYIPKLQSLSKMISELDVLQSFAEVSEKNHYSRPVISSNRNLSIREGRHPVIESFLKEREYINNDCELNDDRELLLITGPNMSGKSTYMRQVALLSIMAQIGCFVPADYAEIPIFDQIFTRIGAADDLVSGQSTFMVEMMETRNALMKSTSDSLILLDEIGRGTSTYDGMAIAQAIIEYVHDNIGAKTLFSTHYHELTDLENHLSKLKNVRVSVKEENDKIVFVHKVEEGAANKSYGIHVAELADLPKDLIERSREILSNFEKSNTVESKKYINEERVVENNITKENKAETEENKAETEVINLLRNMDLLNMTPIESLNTLYNIYKILN